MTGRALHGGGPPNGRPPRYGRTRGVCVTSVPPSGSSQRCLVNADEGPAGIASTRLVMLQPVCEPELYQRLASHAEAMCFPVD